MYSMCEVKTTGSSIVETAMSAPGGAISHEREKITYKIEAIRQKYTKIYLFKCGMCKFSSVNESNLHSHVKIHTNKNTLKEKKSTSTNKHDLNVKKPYLCHICEFRAEKASYLVTHIQTHAGEKSSYTCKECNIKLETLPAHKSHMKAMHPKKKLYKCNKCDFTTFRVNVLNKHIKIHLAQKPKQCKGVLNSNIEKSEIFEIPIIMETLEKPIKSEEEIYEYNYLCKSEQTETLGNPISTATSESLVNTEIVEIHIETQTEEVLYDSNTILKCKSERSKTLENPIPEALEKHIKSEPLELHIQAQSLETPYELCDVFTCNSKQSETLGNSNTVLGNAIPAQTLRNRNKTDMLETKQNSLSKTNKSIKEKSKKTAQKKPKAKQYVCKKCNYKTFSANNFKTHKHICTGEKLYECDICGYKSQMASHVKRHILTHTGEKPYKCKLCDYRAAVAEALRNHLLTHTGEKPYKCDQCDYSAALKRNLKRHIEMHSHVQNECNMCHFKTINLVDFYTHMAKQHSAKLSG